MIRRALRAIGLVSAGMYTAAVEAHKKAEARALKLAEQFGEARADSRAWKAKAIAARDALHKAQANAAEVIQKAETKAADAQQQARRADTLRKEAERRAQQSADLRAMEKELERSARDLTLAREQLMAVEVKLDILEGATNVLDSRTRRFASLGTPPGDDTSV